MPQADVRWEILTGEYPPGRGGVGDYTAALASALAATGHQVRVWAGSRDAAAQPGSPVRVEALHDWGAASRRQVRWALAAAAPPGRVLVQYAPQAFGARSMNLGFAGWVRRLRRDGHDVRVMFHEPFLPFRWRKPHRNLLAAAHRAMAAALLRAGSPVFVSIPAWAELLRPWAPAATTFAWLPIPTTITPVRDVAAVAAKRAIASGGRPGAMVIGHFGTFGGEVATLVGPVVAGVLRSRSDVALLLLGTGAERYADRLVAAEPACAGRVIARGGVDASELSLWIQACDVAVQLYADGASSRRTTLMAALAHGVPVVTAEGPYSEHVWRTSGGVALAAGTGVEAAAATVARLLDHADERADIGRAGAKLYEDCFSIARTVATLVADGAP
jgi:glycosyltransferase involved in cell wall biosynthesis